MITLKTTVETLQTFLQNEFDNDANFENEHIYVELGKFAQTGQLSVNVPGVLIYAEPTKPEQYNFENLPLNRKALITLFAVAASEGNSLQAVLNAMNIAEYCEDFIHKNDALAAAINALENQTNNKTTSVYRVQDSIRFDSMYADYAVAYYEFEINYAANFETEQ